MQNNSCRGRFVKVNIRMKGFQWEAHNGCFSPVGEVVYVAAWAGVLRWWWCQRSRGMGSEWYRVTPSGSKPSC